jgi:hypothetical protein
MRGRTISRAGLWKKRGPCPGPVARNMRTVVVGGRTAGGLFLARAIIEPDRAAGCGIEYCARTARKAIIVHAAVNNNV